MLSESTSWQIFSTMTPSIHSFYPRLETLPLTYLRRRALFRYRLTTALEGKRPSVWAAFFEQRRNDEGFNAFFYSLVSKDTAEMIFSAKRQAFLVDQGYAFRTITHLSGMETMLGLAYKTLDERLDLLAHVMLQDDTAADVERVEDNMWSHLSGGARKKVVQRRAGTLADASGGGMMAYMEQDRKSLKKRMRPESEYFKKERKKLENLRKRKEKEAREAAEGRR